MQMKHLAKLLVISIVFWGAAAQAKTQKYEEQQGDLTVTVKTSDVKLLTKEYQPIDFTFTNNSKDKFVLKSENIGLRLLTRKELKRVSRKRFSVLPFTAILSAQIHTLGLLAAQALGAASLPISLPIIILGTTVHTSIAQYNIRQTNKRERQVFRELRKGIEIEPNSVKKITLHIKRENVKPRFDLRLINKNKASYVNYDINFMQQVEKSPVELMEIGVIDKK